MKRALVTFGVGDAFAEMLEIARPTFEAFADRHGYELRVCDAGLIGAQCAITNRPPSWLKVPALMEALIDHDEALWIDADAVIVDDSEDLEVPADFWQALVAHETTDGQVAGCGFWLVRPPMLPVLARVWSMTQYRDHGWWEQAALNDLLGYRGCPQARVAPSDPPQLIERTFFLDNGWSVHVHDRTPVQRRRVMQATQHPDRAAAMRAWAPAPTTVAA